jgi:hypothetical protein
VRSNIRTSLGYSRILHGDQHWLKRYSLDVLVLEDITVRNSPAWTIHPIECEGMAIRGISILNGIYEEDGPNTDGIDPDSCTDIRISEDETQTTI